MKTNKRNIFIGLLLVNIIGFLLYVFVLKNMIIELYQSKHPTGWFANLVEVLYPRFFTEKHRFDIAFFLEKAEQILLRFTLLVGLAGVVVYRSKWLKHLPFLENNHIQNFWNVKVLSSRIIFLQFFLAIVWIYESFTWYKSLQLLSKAVDFYEPHFLLKWLPFPTSEALFWWFGITYLFLLLSFVPSLSVWAWFFSVVMLLILQGFLYGFGKIDHTYATWGYLSLLLIFLLQEKNKNKEATWIDAWALRLMQTVLACVYLQTGLEKLLISGWTWFEPTTLQTHLLAHGTVWGVWVAQSAVLCVLGSIFTICFEVGFPIILLIPRLKYLFLPMGIVFHTGTYLLVGAGGIPSLWWLAYVVWFLGEKSCEELSQEINK
jgi:hypothetical protein